MEAKQLIQVGLANAKRVTDKALDGLSSTELAWQPQPEANSIGLILFHMFRSEDSFIQNLIQKNPPIWVAEKWYEKLGRAQDDSGSHYSTEQINSFQIPRLEGLTEYGNAVRRKTLEFVDGLSSETLDRKIDLPPMPSSSGSSSQAAPPRRPFEANIGSMLMMTVTHQAQHAGEISYLRGLQRGLDK